MPYYDEYDPLLGMPPAMRRALAGPEMAPELGDSEDMAADLEAFLETLGGSDVIGGGLVLPSGADRLRRLGSTLTPGLVVLTLDPVTREVEAGVDMHFAATTALAGLERAVGS